MSNKVRVFQWNILADGLSRDGFVCSPTLSTTNSGTCTSDEFLTMTKIAKNHNVMHEVIDLFNTPENTEVYERVLKWENRWPKVIERIRRQNPDVICFQEMDHYADALDDLKKLGYVSGQAQLVVSDDGDGLYPRSTIEYIHSYVPLWKYDYVDAENYEVHLKAQSYAFIPKLNSKARKFSQNPDADNDGCAVFWKNDRFDLIGVDFVQFRKYGTLELDTDGALCVNLYDSTTSKILSVVTAHLPSGQTRAREEERLDLVEENGTLRRFAERHARNNPTIVSIDANSDPSEVYVSDITEDVKAKLPNVWRAMHNTDTDQKFKNIWDSYFDPNGDHIVDMLDGLSRPVTVNKVRGPLSNQPDKIGVHSFELIDHIYFDKMHMIGFAKAPVQFVKDDNPVMRLIPNDDEPSDHYPVVVDLNYD